MEKTYTTRGTCCRQIEIETDGDLIKSVNFIGGCAGNTAGISKLVSGMKIQDVIDRLKGTDCKGKGTSCPDQLSKALEEIQAEM